jgi:hypothetical protein
MLTQECEARAIARFLNLSNQREAAQSLLSLVPKIRIDPYNQRSKKTKVKSLIKLGPLKEMVFQWL